MNNIFFPNGTDPLLFQSPASAPPVIPQYNPANDPSFKQRMEQIAQEMYTQQNQQNIKDVFSELDNMLKNAKQTTLDALQQDPEYMDLNQRMQQGIQTELVKLVRNNINQNPELTKIMHQEMELIQKADKNATQEERKNMAELNDYMKNYSQMTFADYKKMKDGKLKQNQENNENNS